jgi:hypothetical protein
MDKLLEAARFINEALHRDSNCAESKNADAAGAVRAVSLSSSLL